MAHWDWAYEADLVPLADHCKAVRVLTEYGLASKNDADFDFPGQHGVIPVYGKLMGAGNVMMATYLWDSEPDGSITHVDGSAGHIMENLSVLKRIFNRAHGPILITRTAPHIGVQEILVELIDQPQEGQDRHEIIWTLKAAKPLWRSGTSVSGAVTSGAFNPGGDAPVDDMILTFSTAGSIFNTTTDTGFEVTDACVVNCAALQVTQAGNPAPGLILPRNEKWLHLEGGIDNTLTVVGTVNMSHFPKWA